MVDQSCHEQPDGGRGTVPRESIGGEMGYLGLPRIHLLGRFFADPSTVNNDPSHYDPAVTDPSPWQQPNGLHRFTFPDVTVVSCIDASGDLVLDDPLVGASVTSTDQPSPAKLVDLDVYQQAVPVIYGFNLQIQVTSTQTLVGSLDPCALNSLRTSRVLPTRGWQDWDGYGESSFGGDSYASGVYQGLLRVQAKDWPAGAAGVLAELRSATVTEPDGTILLAIRMVVDDFQNVPGQRDFSTGRVLATIGPLEPDEVAIPSVVGGRRLIPRPIDPKTDPWNWPDFGNVPAVFVDRGSAGKRLVLDLANAMALLQPGGTPVPTGDLAVALKGVSYAPGTFQANQDLYESFGGIVELPVPDAYWPQRSAPLQIFTSRTDIGGPILWAEDPAAPHIEAADRVFRMAPSSGQAVAVSTVRITRQGAPWTGITPGVLVQPVFAGICGATVPPQAGYPGDTPQASGALVASASAVDAQGNCQITLKVTKDPGSRTAELDGQLYFVVVYDPTEPPPDLEVVPPDQEALISVVVDSAFTGTADWSTVSEILAPYVKLYPGMTDMIDLSQEQAFFTFSVNPPWAAMDPTATPWKIPDGRVIKAGAIPLFMTRAIDDPRLMPVTRDLSTAKRDLILTYIADLQALVSPMPPATDPSSDPAPTGTGPTP